MSHTDRHAPFSTTAYATREGHNAHDWQDAAKHLGRLKCDAEAMRRQVRARKRQDAATLHRITRGTLDADAALYATHKRDAFALPSY